MRNIISAIVTIPFLLVSSEYVNAQPNTIPANGQVPPAIPDCCQELSDRIEQLKAELDTLKAKDAEHEDTLTQLARAVDTNGNAIKDLIGKVTKNEDDIRSMLQPVAENSRAINHIAKPDGQGGYYPNLVGNMQKPVFRQEIRDVVRQSGARTQGRLRIYNPGPNLSSLYINGAQWRALVGWSYVWVPIGNTSVTQVPGTIPPVRGGSYSDWNPDPRDGVYEIVYNLSDPWR